MIIVITGGFIGIATGGIVGWTILSQNEQWVGVMPPIMFPWKLFGTILAFGLVSSFFAAFIPMKAVLGKTISTLLKGYFDE